MDRLLVCLAATAAAAQAEPLADDVIYDTLRFADEQTYDGGNANAYSGIALFGSVADLQLCDDFSTSDRSVVTRVTGDYLCFFGRIPAGGLQIDVFEDRGGHPAEDALCSTTVPVAQATSWSDPHYGLFGVRFTADVRIPLEPHTSYYLMLQAIDLTPEGDWYYQIYDNDSRIGGDRFLRNGGRAGNDFFFTWRSGEITGYGRGDVGMQVRAIPAPGPAAALVAFAACSATRRRR